MESHNTSNDQKHRPSNSELLSSAKLVAEAAKSGLINHEMDKIDKAKVAGAAADLIGAASHYGNLEEKGLGKYMEKGEQYLHQYSHSSTTTTHSTSTSHSTPTGTHTTSSTTTQTHSSDSDGDGDGGGGGGGSGGAAGGGGGAGGGGESGGYGDYINMAQSLFKKH
ncbi:hypothetical protein NE237_015226 [Protea cynaroides]|uniref:Uncharacterized protein n=1 Tax=Protea cynaroides TaxID=273540 RepID=A0A9Q0KDM1_9MAGN|nr:hypothetical protein NE237_015226 [Protea cynaroides]